MDADRLARQLRFIVEIDKLKDVYRQTLLMNGKRYENDAEHSWHLAVMAVFLFEYAADKNLDLARVMKMLLIHDLVEIDAGDTFCYDDTAAQTRESREKNAADRIFNLLPSEQASDIRSLWEEFEARGTPEARYAAALDRFQPLLHNYNTHGAAWQKHCVTSDKVFARNKHIANGAPALWQYAEDLIRDAVQKGYLRR